MKVETETLQAENNLDKGLKKAWNNLSALGKSYESTPNLKTS